MWPCWVHVAFQNGMKKASGSASISLDYSRSRARSVPAALVALTDCTSEQSVFTCPGCSGIRKGLSSVSELHPEVIYESSAPELHPEVIYENSYTHFHQLCCEDNLQQSDRAGSLAGNCLNGRLELG